MGSFSVSNSCEKALAKSSFFAEGWYLREYLDVQYVNLTPMQHFIKFGLALKRNPNPVFDYRYLKSSSDDPRNDLLDFLNYGRFEQLDVVLPGISSPSKKLGSSKNGRVVKRIDQILKKVFSFGFFNKGYEELQTLACSMNPEKCYRANKALAWISLDLSQKECYQQAIRSLGVCLEYNVNDSERVHLFIMLSEALYKDGQAEKSLQLLKAVRVAFGFFPDLEIAYFNVCDKEEKIEILERICKFYELPAINFNESTCKPYDSLNSDLNVVANQHLCNEIAPKVSVIVPCYNCENTVGVSLQSLLNQSWHNLEILAVDDCSTDRTRDVLKEWSSKDCRIKVLNTETNSGAYIARNVALAAATGKFVTCHDSDDWSHRLKIELQADNLIKNPHVIANRSFQVRASEDLVFHRRGKFGQFIFSNMSSLMFDRLAIKAKIGFWDQVRFGGDSEFLTRLKQCFGAASVLDLNVGPLSIQRQTAGSLTGSSKFGYNGFFYGARKIYFDSYRAYHSFGCDTYLSAGSARRFPIPNVMCPNRHLLSSHYDVIIVSDFRMVGGSTLSSVEEIKAQKEAGLKTGLIQLYRYDYAPVGKGINPKIRELLGDDVNFIAYGESVECDHVIIRYPPVLEYHQEFFPSVNAKKASVIINQPPMSDYTDDGVRRYNFANCEKNLRQYLSCEVTWYAIGPLVRDAIYRYHSAEARFISLSDKDWSNIINVDAWFLDRSAPVSSKMTIGRHSRDNFVKWPSSKESMLAIYPDSDVIDVKILGGAKAPLSVLGYKPSNWQVYEFGEVDPIDFLKSLDIFVYFAHPDWVEAFGRVILEAMASGIIVVIPEIYQPLFGEAAIYASEENAINVAWAYYSNRGKFLSQTKKTEKIVRSRFSYMAHIERLALEPRDSRSSYSSLDVHKI